MNIGVLIITRGDRPKFLEQAKKMLKEQTLQPNEICIVNDEPLSKEIDITYRYRIGFERLKDKVDVIIFWEDDDYYSPKYIETMFTSWVHNGKPELFGLAQTIYYHLGLRAFNIIKHDGRASAMSTMVSTKLNINFPNDNEPFFDLHLWRNNKGVTFAPKEILNIGIKHGIGKCGGKGHLCNFKYNNNDDNMLFLRNHVTEEFFKFYNEVSSNL